MRGHVNQRVGLRRRTSWTAMCAACWCCCGRAPANFRAKNEHGSYARGRSIIATRNVSGRPIFYFRTYPGRTNPYELSNCAFEMLPKLLNISSPAFTACTWAPSRETTDRWKWWAEDRTRVVPALRVHHKYTPSGVEKPTSVCVELHYGAAVYEREIKPTTRARAGAGSG